MDRLPDGYMGFLPNIVLRQLAGRGRLPDLPLGEYTWAAVAFVDISGFTTLTEQMDQQGEEGIEILQGALDTFFGNVIMLVEAHRGDVVKFAGDAVTAIWPVSDEEGLENSIRHALQCALETRDALNGYEAADDLTIHLKVLVTAGRILTAHVGSASTGVEFVVAGEAMERFSELADSAEAGQVILSREAFQRIADEVELEHERAGGVVVTQLRHPLETMLPPRAQAAPSLLPALRCYVPKFVLARLDAGHGEWIAEYREVTVLFACVFGLSHEESDTLPRLQQVVVGTQEVLGRFDGMLNRVTVDDKGLMLLGSFGLPGLTHDDDAVRAVRAALALRNLSTTLRH